MRSHPLLAQVPRPGLPVQQIGILVQERLEREHEIPLVELRVVLHIPKRQNIIELDLGQQHENETNAGPLLSNDDKKWQPRQVTDKAIFIGCVFLEVTPKSCGFHVGFPVKPKIVPILARLIYVSSPSHWLGFGNGIFLNSNWGPFGGHRNSVRVHVQESFLILLVRILDAKAIPKQTDVLGNSRPTPNTPRPNPWIGCPPRNREAKTLDPINTGSLKFSLQAVKLGDSREAIEKRKRTGPDLFWGLSQNHI